MIHSGSSAAAVKLGAKAARTCGRNVMNPMMAGTKSEKLIVVEAQAFEIMLLENISYDMRR
jgi:hypothetical protein